MQFPTTIKARLFAGLVILSLGIANGEIRTWTDTSGKFKIEAEFLSLNDGMVTLQRANGKTQKVPLEKLSEANREVVKELAGTATADVDKAKQEESIAAIKKLGGRVGRRSGGKPGLQVALSWENEDEAKVEVEVALSHLEGLTDLKRLDLLGSRFTDAGLVHLEGLTGLERLDLGFCDNIGNAGMVHLKGLTNLRTLSLLSTKVTDAGFVHLSGLSNLRRLSLVDSNLTGTGFKHLRGATNLEVVRLKGSLDFKNVGLAHLKDHTNLTYLSLRWTKVTNAGLKHLERLTKLKHLDLNETKVTEAGKKKLQAALPNCKIEWYPPQLQR